MPKLSSKWTVLALALALPLAAQAHKMWMVPSATNVSGADPWVTVDAAVSNDLFFPDHVPGDLSRLVITAPDGSTVAPENAATGKYRSVFDVHLQQQGTYRIALVNQGVFAGYELGGEKKRWRGEAAELDKAIPAGAQHVQVSEASNRVETFVTNGKPSDGALKPGGKGLELVPVTHVTDLVAGEGATFQLLLDGKPAPDLKVTAIAGGTRYRNAQEEIEATTGKDGRFTLTWPHAGMYWVNASTQDGKTSVKQARQRRLSYTAVLEVLPQ
ncbi:DUF4198 domain-containing protein [Fulvimonas soli]|jgi:uncharacterized GH25 family protein|uniref:Putative GH25 family protein n=1 Tax=Fulvimonas soli TaxID=155197 RepID=A0A316IH35_9GAMM|nr:DUF4198 domain-containing protein [Fulvimonas soli]PWK92120.1 putative GH25 family protein [Fulvimonas soli]TNY27849.1 ABC transporter permease [Fulvimonas soli]